MSEEMVKSIQENAKHNERKQNGKKLALGAAIGVGGTLLLYVGSKVLGRIFGNDDADDEDYVEVSDSTDEETDESDEETDD